MAKESPGMKLSFVIPVYNEEKRIENTVQGVRDFAKKLTDEVEWIFVDDGCTDRTEQLAQGQLGEFHHRWIKLGHNQGKGRAVQRGMLEARGDVVLFMDADLSTPPEEYEQLLKPLEEGYDIAVGSRGAGSHVLVHQIWLRETMGRIFNRIARLLTFKQIGDSQCGFKAFRREAAHRLFRLQKIAGFAFDAEIVFLAQKLGYRIAEVPITWVNSPDSKVRIIRDSVQMLVDLLRIRWLHLDLEKEQDR